MSQLKFWNKQNSNSSNKDKDKDSINDSSSNNSNNNNSNNLNGNSSTNDAKKDKKNWLHTPEALMNGHVVYLVKFMGNLPVEQAKGIEVVKDAIRKLQFAQQMKKAETGTQEKFKKVEITISVDGVAIQEPRTQKILHQFPLHNISYCADEKGVKKFFSFIAKNVKSVNGAMSATSNNSTGGSTASSSNSEDTHECFVFISNKLASDITLTIGQAFDLAYRKYMNATEKNDLGKAQQKIIEMEKTITIYRNRLSELSLKLPKSELDAMLFKLGIQDITELPNLSVNNDNGSALTNGQSANDDKLLIDTASVHSNNSAPAITSSSSSSFVPMVPPRNNLPSQILNKSNSQKMDELLLNSDSDSDFDPRADEVLTDGLNKTDSNDIFGFEPTKNPYGQQLFFNNNDNKLQNKNSNNMNGMSGGSGNQQQHTLVSHHSFTNELNITPPLLAPPPKAAATRRTISTSSNSNGLTNGNTDLFGSDPFDTSSTNIFKGKLSSVSVDDFSLESLDPLRK